MRTSSRIPCEKGGGSSAAAALPLVGEYLDLLFAFSRYMFGDLYHDECHERCVSHCDENIHFCTSLSCFISKTSAVLLSDYNIVFSYG